MVLEKAVVSLVLLVPGWTNVSVGPPPHYTDTHTHAHTRMHTHA